MSPHRTPSRLNEVLSELKKDYLEKFPTKLSVLRELTEKQNWLQLEEEYHKLKGTGKTYGFPEVSTVCEQMEALAKFEQNQIPDLFEKAVTLLETIYQHYLENKPLNLESDSFARSLLALKVK